MKAAALPNPWVDLQRSGARPWAFAAALAVAGFLHLALLLGLSFERRGPATPGNAALPLEVIVLRPAQPSGTEPPSAGASERVEPEGIETAEIAEPRPAPDPASLAAKPPALPEPPPIAQPADAEEPPLVAQIAEPPLAALLEPMPAQEMEAPPAMAHPESAPAHRPAVRPLPKPAAPAVTAAQIMASRGREIAELNARIERASSASAQGVRRKTVSASTREYKYASYLEAWRRKVERIGNLNYPEEAKKHRLYGSLLLQAGVRADGSLESVRVLRSSGVEVLDQAAVRIVELAAPFAPLPPAIKAETDVLDITRTWQFLSSDRLGWDN